MAVKWELDLGYERWDRAGSKGVDTWYELPDRKREGSGRAAHPPPDGLDATSFPSEPTEGGRE